MTAISSREFKTKYQEILNRDISDYDIQKLINFKIIKKIRFKDSYYYQEIPNLNQVLPTVIEVLNDH